MPTSIGTEAISSVAGLREFDPGNVVGSFASTHYGLPGEAAGYFLGADDPSRSVTVSPLAGLALLVAQIGIGVFLHLQGDAETAKLLFASAVGQTATATMKASRTR